MRHDRHYVEELEAQRGAPIGRMISADRLEPNPQQPRVDLGDLEELIESIREKGVLEPLLVRPSEVGGRYMIISGERRFRAALEAGLDELPCIEMDVDDRAVAEIALIENLQRKDLTAFEEADGLFLLVDRFGYTHEDISQKIGKARSSVTEALTISSIDAEIRDLCQSAGIASKSMLLQVARLPNPDAMKAFITRIASQGMTRDEARKARSNKSSRSQPYVYRFSAPNREFSLQLKFRKTRISDDELIDVLEGILEELKMKDRNKS